MTKAPLTVIVPVRNEALNIAACLESVAFADEVFVVDSKSDDATAEIAAARGAKVVQFAYDGGWPKKKNWALANLPIRNEWIFLLDADERVPADLAGEIAAAIREPHGYDGFYLNRRLIFLGRWIRHCGWYPSWNLRLFRRGKGRFERLHGGEPAGTGDVEVHEHVVLEGQAGFLRHDLLHEDFKDVSHFIDRHNRYSTWEAAFYTTLAAGRRGASQVEASAGGNPVERKRWMRRLWVHLPFRPLLRFFWMYVLRLGFLDGRPGLVFCTLMSFHEAVINAKLYERSLKRR